MSRNTEAIRHDLLGICVVSEPQKKRESAVIAVFVKNHQILKDYNSLFNRPFKTSQGCKLYCKTPLIS